MAILFSKSHKMTSNGPDHHQNVLTQSRVNDKTRRVLILVSYNKAFLNSQIRDSTYLRMSEAVEKFVISLIKTFI